MKKVSILIGCLFVVFIMVTILSTTIKPVMAASSSLPEGAFLGNGIGAMFGGPWADMDDMDLGYGGMMGPFGSMNPWMMQGMDQF